ncbi:hypothetical protein [Acinetobacter bereziniae]|uniref:hypothetical protein n=1 Tax=Acinetobacter bereziniae TaxID=106648 RepID=UPI00125F05B3|nr:hypothetical protein [Acinetobacter bereziniae]
MPINAANISERHLNLKKANYEKSLLKEQHEVKVGFKQSISEKDLKKAQAMLRVSQTTKAEATKHFGMNSLD